jgi:hypothetical protein
LGALNLAADRRSGASVSASLRRDVLARREGGWEGLFHRRRRRISTVAVQRRNRNQRSSRVPGIAPRHPPTPPDVRVSRIRRLEPSECFRPSIAERRMTHTPTA